MDYQVLRDMVENQIEKFNSISENQWNEKLSDEKWSKKEILGHLCDSALTNMRRFVVTQYKENENIVYDQNFWVKAQNYQNTTILDIVYLWKYLNLQIVNVVENIPDELLDNVCDTTKLEKQSFTLRFIIDEYISHMNHHLKVINNDKI
ncbi:DinB family protein [Epilithonimonas zeae]|uniref:DinB superfamily protein n=1 Tax=Epilithonimonas zeae TaxID=1416779 RepID=A0A1N6DXF0_9FLAO|nr:DinB family protein [Epilithonimonas zeae]SIN75476.1 DinB superfamily protein [Epilithonimonas zeae]